MKWLKDYIDLDLPIEDLVHRLTMSGQEVEKVEAVGTDTVLELEVTPNRADCLNYIGISRELAAILDQERKESKIKFSPNIDQKVDIQIQDTEGCCRYIGIVIKGVSIKESPDWLKERLTAIGMRPVNNIVDITNFCLMEQGQPLHAFDYDQLQGGKIVVRRAEKGEQMVTIDGEGKELDETMLVIADNKRPVAMAGVMGGKETEVTSSTQNILLESAYFNPMLVRRMSRKAALSTDSSYRFERGVDFTTVQKGAHRAIDLILELAGGVVESYSDVQVEENLEQTKTIEISVEEINRRIGSDLPVEECGRIMRQLDFLVDIESGVLSVASPSFRRDIKQKEDIIEEIARVEGYDNLPMTLPRVAVTQMTTDKKFQWRREIRKILMNQGASEIVPFSLISEVNLKNLGFMDDEFIVAIKNPLSVEQAFMRPVMLPSTLNVVLNNFNRGQKDLFLYEIGKVYRKQKNILDAPDLEEERIAFVMTGSLPVDWRDPKKRTVDFYDMKGVVEVLLSGSDSLRVVNTDKWSFMDSRQCVSIHVDGNDIGFAGRVDDEVLRKWGIKGVEVLFCEITAKSVFDILEQKKKFYVISEYPAMIRDISLALSRNISYQQIKDAIQEVQPKFLSEIRFVDEYLGDKLPEDQKGLTVSLTYRCAERTLTDEAISSVHEGVVTLLGDKFSAFRR